MIKVINFEGFKEQLPNTYGYISLGGFKLPDEFNYIQSAYYKATCKIGERTVDLIIVQAGYFSDSVIVLGDLTNIPGEFLVDQKELYMALEIEMEKLNPKIDQWMVNWSEVPGTTSTIDNNFTCKVDYVTKS